MRTTPAQDKILNRLYRQIEITVLDGNEKKTVRSLERKGIVNIDAVPMQKGEQCRHFYFRVTLTDMGDRYTCAQHGIPGW
jgi:hypothetical protein